jgi:hypothetical protein
MKVIGVDNFDRELYSDKLIAENVPEFYANLIAELLNARLCNHDDATIFYKSVPDDYKLYKFEP